MDVSAAHAHRFLLLLTAAIGYAAVGVAFALFEVPGLGLGHFFYLAIALAALATDAVFGAIAGLVATCVFAGAVYLNPAIPLHDLLTVSTGIRCITFVATGAVIGWFASENRALIAKLRTQAEQDFLTGLLNARAFDAAVAQRCTEGTPFALLLGDFAGLKQVNIRDGYSAGNLLLVRFADQLAALGVEKAARIGGDEFAALAPAGDPEAAIALCRKLEDELGDVGLRTSWGWSLFPVDGRGRNLFKRADERLSAAKIARAGVEPVATLLATGSYRPN